MIRLGVVLALIIALGGCTVVPKAPSPTLQRPTALPTPSAKPAEPSDAKSVGVDAGPSIESLGISADNATRALASFRASCPALLRRIDSSRLTRNSDWQSACAAAATATDPNLFFQSYFESIKVGAGSAFATGYYEPEIAVSRTPVTGGMPVYALPPDLVERTMLKCPVDYPATLAPAEPACKRSTSRGRIKDDVFVPYYDRTEIEDGALSGRALELAYAVDPIQFFVLQIQGSGRLRFNDGTIMRIAYAGQNGHPYTGIGRVMRDRGLLQPGKATMPDIEAWLRANPEAGRDIMRMNKSWVFFKELTGDGPLGALNIPVRARTSVAADPHFIPLGAPVFLQTMDRTEANGLWVAQDTGGAIKGANRVDTFWGAGDDALRVAGGMTSRGAALILVPKGTYARLMSDAPSQR